MPDAHANFAYSTVATAPSPAGSGLSLVVQTGDGAKFPTPPFNATVGPANTYPLTTANSEIVRVSAITGDTLTIVRQQEGSSARTIAVGDQIFAGVTKKTLTDIESVIGSVTPTTARAYRTAAFSVAAGAVTKVPFDTTSYDPGGNYSTTNGRYTCPTTGYYFIHANIVLQGAASSQALIYKNGVQVTAGLLEGSAYGTTVSDMISCQAGDYIEVYLYDASGGAIALNVTKQDFNFLDITQVAGAATIALGPQVTPTAARAYRSAAFSPTGGVYTKIPFDTISYDPGANFSTANGRYVCPTTGYYLVTGQFQVANTTTTMIAAIYKNGAAYSEGNGSTYNRIAVADIVYCQAGDYLEIWAFDASGASLATANGSIDDYMSVVQVAGQNMVAGLSPTAQSADYSVSAGQLVLMTGTHNVNLPASPLAGAMVGVVALTGAVTVIRGGANSLTQYAYTGLTQITVPQGTYCYLVYLAGVWYVVDQSVRPPFRTAARATATNKVATVGGASNSKLALDTKTYDPGTNFDTANNRYTAPASGYYQVNAEIITSATVSQLVISLYKNGASYQQGSNHVNSSSGAEAMSDLIFLAAGDYVELWYYVGAGSAVNISGALSAVLQEAS